MRDVNELDNLGSLLASMQGITSDEKIKIVNSVNVKAVEKSKK